MTITTRLADSAAELFPLLPDVSYWDYRDEKLTCYTLDCNVVFSADQLNVLQPKLVPLLRRFMNEDGGENTVFTAHVLHAQLVHVCCPLEPLFLDGELYRTADIRTITWAKKSSVAWLRAMVYTVAQDDPDYVTSVSVRCGYAEVSILNLYWPGWQERYCIGEGLGYDRTELARYVCQSFKSEGPAVDLPAAPLL